MVRSVTKRTFADRFALLRALLKRGRGDSTRVRSATVDEVRNYFVELL